MGPIERELREWESYDNWKSRINLVEWIMFPVRRGGMSPDAYRIVREVAPVHGLDKCLYPEDVLSYAIEAAEALGL